MQFNYYFLKKLTPQLETRLVDKQLTQSFSQSKNELVLVFANSNEEFTIRASFNNELNILTFPSEFRRARKNTVELFTTLIGKKVESLVQYRNERAFSVLFTSGYNLLFKLHGGRANILLFENEVLIALFRNNFANDKLIQLSDLHRDLDQSNAALKKVDFDLSQIYPTFDKHIKQYLQANDFDSGNSATRIEILNKLIQKLDSGEYFIYSDKKGAPYINLLKKLDEESIFTCTDPLEACNQLANQYYRVYKVQKEKNEVLAILKKDIARGKNYVLTSQRKLDKIVSDTRYDQIADILMANLHLQVVNKKSIELDNFYSGKKISIKLKSSASMQANAETYYRKAKNQQIEIEKLKENIQSKENSIAELSVAIEQLLQSEDQKEIRKIKTKYAKEGKEKDDQRHKPYIDYLIDGYSFYVGKNARSNDELLKKYASKEDVWLHARNVSGSHVIIKKTGSAAVPEATLEKAAQIAAWYSKGKSDTLCPVIYTQRKYVTKMRNGEPGEVKVLREQVILVNPCQNPQ